MNCDPDAPPTASAVKRRIQELDWERTALQRYLDALAEVTRQPISLEASEPPARQGEASTTSEVLDEILSDGPMKLDAIAARARTFKNWAFDDESRDRDRLSAAL